MPARGKKAASKSPAPTRKSTRGASSVTETKEEPKPAARSRSTRGSATSQSPSPKKARKASPSPAPAPRTQSRGRAGRATKDEPTQEAKGKSRSKSGQGDEETETPKKGRVTRAVVQEAQTTTPRGRSRARKASPAEPTPAPTRSSRTPAKQEKPKPSPQQTKARSTSRGSAKQSASQAKKTPASRSRSRGAKKDEEEETDMPSAQIVLTKCDSPKKKTPEKPVAKKSPPSSAKKSSPPAVKKSPSPKKSPPSASKVSPKASSRSSSRGRQTPAKTSPKSSPSPRARGSTSKTSPSPRSSRGKKSDDAKTEEKTSEDVETKDEAQEMEEDKPEAEVIDDVKETKDEPKSETEPVNEEAESVEETVVEPQAAEPVSESEDKPEPEFVEKAQEDSKEEEEKMEEDEPESESLEKEEAKEDEPMEETDEVREEEEPVQEEKSVEEPAEAVEEPVTAVEEPVAAVEEPVAAVEEPVSAVEEPVTAVEEPVTATEEPVAVVEEPAPEPVSEAQNATEDVKEETTNNPASEIVSVEPTSEPREPTPTQEEVLAPVQMEATSEQATEQIEVNSQVQDSNALASADQPNGGDLGSPSRKRKWDDAAEFGDEISAKKLRRSLEMTDVSCEDNLVKENGEDSAASNEPMETGVAEQAVSQPECEPAKVEEPSIESSYVMVQMDEVPAANSDEIMQVLPPEENAKPLSQEPAAVVSDTNSSSQSVGSNVLFSRKFIPNPSFGTLEENKDKQFSIVSYNVLAQCHLERNDYSFTDPLHLEESYRHTNLMKELEYLDGDVVCLQEVGPNYFKNMLQPQMQSLGYESLIKKRTEDYYEEGEATFYRTSRFTLVESNTYSLKDLAYQELQDGCVNEEVQTAIKKYLDLPDVLIITKLKCNKTGNILTVGNVHIQWGRMQMPDAQCIQIVCAIKELVKQAGNDGHAHVLCGDFNSEVTSAGYRLATEGYLSDDILKQLQALENLEMPDNTKTSLVNQLWRAFQHTSNLKSAYGTTQSVEPEVTSYNKVMLAAVDYIFFSVGSLETVGVLETASPAQIMATGGIPDQTFPSDHVSIKAVLSFT